MKIKRKKKELYMKRKRRVRKKIEGMVNKPRLSVFRSSKHIYVQAIDDINGNTISSSSSLDKKIKKNVNFKKMKIAYMVGLLMGDKLKKLGIELAVFDRNGFKYKGRIIQIANGIRRSGLIF